MGPFRDAAYQKTLHVVVERIARSRCEHRFELDFSAELRVADTGPLELVRLAAQENAGRRVSTPVQARAGLAGPRRPDQLLEFRPDQILSQTTDILRCGTPAPAVTPCAISPCPPRSRATNSPLKSWWQRHPATSLGPTACTF